VVIPWIENSGRTAEFYRPSVDAYVAACTELTGQAFGFFFEVDFFLAFSASRTGKICLRDTLLKVICNGLYFEQLLKAVRLPVMLNTLRKSHGHGLAITYGTARLHYISCRQSGISENVF
jgi:hypothetical protein